MIPPRIKNVIANDNYDLIIEYETNEKKIYNMKQQIEKSYFEKLKDINYFKLAKSVQTTIEWPDGEDIDPNELYEKSCLIS